MSKTTIFFLELTDHVNKQKFLINPAHIVDIQSAETNVSLFCKISTANGLHLAVAESYDQIRGLLLRALENA